MGNGNGNGAGRLQSWLTPALVGAGLILMGLVWGEVRATRIDVQTALRTLAKHEIVLVLNGLLQPKTRTTGIE